MANQKVTALDVPVLNRIEEIRVTMGKLEHLAHHRTEKVVYLGRIWTYEDMVCLGHEYYALGRNYDLNLKNFEVWLSQETKILAKHKLAWPLN